VRILNYHEIKKEDNENRRPFKCMKKPGAYQNWFQPHLWPQMLVVVKKYKNNKTIITFLQNVYKSLGVPSPYAKLTRSTMWEWFTKEGELKENYMEVN
jgi:hypothetical protein